MTRQKQTMTRLLAGILLICMFAAFAGCQSAGRKGAASIEQGSGESYLITDVSQLNGKRIGCLHGASYIEQIKLLFSDITIVEYMTFADAIAALQSGRIDTYITDEPMAYFQLRKADGLAMLPGTLTIDRYGFMLSLDDTQLCRQINEVLHDLREQGVLDELKEKWVTGNEEPVFDASQDWDKPNGTLRVCLSLDNIPFAYLADEQIAGYDVELMYLIAEKLGCGLQISQCGFHTLINRISSGKDDIAIGCITYTPERAQNVLFTDTTYESGTVAVIPGDTSSANGFFAKLGTSFTQTFLKENRWKLVFSGLLTTLELALFTLAFGSLIGFLFSFPLRSKNKMIRCIAGALSRITDGLPLLIILMVFYYVIFAKTTLPAIAVGVLGLSLDFANTVAGIVNTGVAGVDKGQIEAAEAMGYPKWKSFCRIVFPQAANQMFPQYAGAIIAMVKGTSIIGYIAVVDLTKAGDIIRSLTYEAFFPLLCIAAIYFALIQIILALLKAAAKKIDPKHRKRVVKGVVVHD